MTVVSAWGEAAASDSMDDGPRRGGSGAEAREVLFESALVGRAQRGRGGLVGLGVGGGAPPAPARQRDRKRERRREHDRDRDEVGRELEAVVLRRREDRGAV